MSVSRTPLCHIYQQIIVWMYSFHIQFFCIIKIPFCKSVNMAGYVITFPISYTYNWGSGLRNMPCVTQLASGRTGIRTQDYLTVSTLPLSFFLGRIQATSIEGIPLSFLPCHRLIVFCGSDLGTIKSFFSPLISPIIQSPWLPQTLGSA